MSGPSLRELEEQRERLYAQLAEIGDFRRGSVTGNYRRCGKANCACAARSSRARAAVFVNRSVRGKPTPRGRQPRPRKWRRCAGLPHEAVRRPGRADRGGERRHLRGPTGLRPAARPTRPAGPDGEKGGSVHGSRGRPPTR